MSRCFPFPPPGYEIKAKPDDVNLPIKEKDKEKKHKDKKDKKDKKKKDRSERKEKEKSEGKEKEKSEGKHKEDKGKEKSEGKHKEDKGKEKSEGKHKEDKDRKHKKHKDKKDRKSDTLASPEEKKIVVGSLDNNQKSEKLVLDRKPNNGVDDYRMLVELGKRVRNDGGATNNQAVHKITLTEQRKFSSSDVSVEPFDHINNRREKSWMANGETPRSGENQIKVKDTNKRKNGNENETKDDVGKGYGSKNEDEHKNKKAEEKKRKKEKKKEKKKERSKEKAKQGASEGSSLDFHDNNNSQLDLVNASSDSGTKLPKHKEPVPNGFLHDNRIRPNSSSRPALSSLQVSQNGIGTFHPSQTNTNLAVEKGAVVVNRKVDGVLSSSPQSVIKNVRNISANSTTAEHRKAKGDSHVGRNGLNSSHIVGNEGRLEKITNNIQFSEKFPTLHPLVENGRKIPDPIHKTGNKELSMNGLCEGRIENSSRSSCSSAEVKEKKVSSTSMKPPHPDTRYLSQILTVPTVEMPQYDDQDWLFGCEDWDSRPKRPKLCPPEIEETKHVWAEAVQLESADITALPYVIPY